MKTKGWWLAGVMAGLLLNPAESKLKTEWIKKADPVTGRLVWQITSHDSASVAAYFERQPFTADDRYIVFGSKRSGSWQVYRADLRNGEIVLLSKKQDLAPFSFTIHPDGKSVCYIHDNILYKTDVKKRREKVWMDFNGKFSTPLWFSSSFSADARFTVVTTKTDSGIGIYRVDLENGTVHGLVWKAGPLSHPLLCPTNPDLITFVPGPDTQNDMSLPMEKRARTWIADLKTGRTRPFLIMPYGFRATHETWAADGRRFFFYKKSVPGWTPVAICSIDQNGEDWKQYYHHDTIRLGHGISSRDGLWFLSDGQDPQNNPLILIHLQSGEATFLCWPNASMDEKAGQYGHVHPTLSASGRFACYTSDATGVPQVYVVPTGLK
ncbi:hypothetical protein GX408_11140 [bacterium]|nr:hypothetical protein [bacterium]